MQTQYVSQSESVVTQSFSELHWPTTQGDTYTIFSGPRILDTNWHTHTQTVRVSLKSFDWNTDSLGGTVWTVEFLCPVDGTFVLAAFIPFHSVRPQKVLENS